MRRQGFATTDKVLRYYLPTSVGHNKPFRTAAELKTMTYQRPFTQIITGFSNEIMRKTKGGSNSSTSINLIRFLPRKGIVGSHVTNFSFNFSCGRRRKSYHTTKLVPPATAMNHHDHACLVSTYLLIGSIVNKF